MSPRTLKRWPARSPIRRGCGEQAQDAAKQVRPFVEKALKEQPMATLAGGAVLGFLLGALWKK